MTDLTLRTLLIDCQKGRSKAFKPLFEHFYRYVMSVAMRYSGNQAEAEEILNDSFFKVYTHLKHFTFSDDCDIDSELRRWIRRITVNTSIDYIRKNKNIRELQEIPFHYEDSQEDVLSKISGDEILLILQSAPPQYRAVFNLFVIEGYTHPEIASMLGISEGTSKSNLFKARQYLKNKIVGSNGNQVMNNYGS